MTPRLSVVILTLNEERNLPVCLASLAGLDCEVFVVDSGSTDNTLAIARAAGAQVFSHPFGNYSQQRNWSLDNLPFGAPWILNLDADEHLTPELAQEIAASIAGTEEAVSGFLLRRRTQFLGRWIRHGGHYPNFQLRLFRRGRGRCEDRRYDQHFLVDGPVRALSHDYIDVVASSLAVWSTRHVRWAEAEADELAGQRAASEGRVAASLASGPIGRKRWLRERVYARAPLFVRPFAYWIYRYFFRLGFLDGAEGMIFHFLQGFWYRFLVDAVLYERELTTGGSARKACPVERTEAGSE